MQYSAILETLWYDGEQRETLLREVVNEHLERNPPPTSDEHIIATYFFAFRTHQLKNAVEEISYHATSGIKHPPTGSLLEACSAKPAGVDAFDETGKLGLLHVAFPLKMMLHPDGHITSNDILHTLAAAIIFDVFENQDARLIAIQIPPHVLATFPGPAYGPSGIRRITGFDPHQPAFGTILKPTAGITPREVESLVAEVAACPLFLFIKEDEDLYPDLDYSPVAERTRLAVKAIERAKEQRNGQGLLFAPHISSAPHEIMATVEAVLEAGATALMFSETWSGGSVRMVREATRNLTQPPAIYGHNAGIGVKTKGIWREVIDLLARLDGIDFRQTAPVKPGVPFLKPYGKEWLASESVLTKEILGIHPTMVVRAGALDQGNIGLNLADVTARRMEENVLFLAGSAINSIKNTRGRADAQLGATAMMQAIELYRSGVMDEIPAETYVRVLHQVAIERKLAELCIALQQRYPQEKF